MLAFRYKPSDEATKYNLNVLPCRVHRNGPSKVIKRVWSPVAEKDGTKTVYFRGRRLQGRTVKLPKGYSGMTVSKSEQSMPSGYEESHSARSTLLGDDATHGEDKELAEPVKMLKEEARFDGITVWGHDILPSSEDNFVKGIDEWINFAEAIHTQPQEDMPPSTAASPR